MPKIKPKCIVGYCQTAIFAKGYCKMHQFLRLDNKSNLNQYAEKKKEKANKQNA
jgi:hypothetical protein